MAHIHDLIDFTVSAYIVHPKLDKVLLIHHKKYDRWLQVGGHVELNEDPDQALMREIMEETGLEVTVIAERPGKGDKLTKALWRPDFMQIHPAGDNHQHVDLKYIVIAKSETPKLAPTEHNDIRWFSRNQLYDKTFAIPDHDRHLFLEALRIAKERR